MYDEDTDATVPVSVDDSEVDEQELEFFFGNVRKIWHKQHEEWYFSVTDVISVLTDSADPKQYIKRMRSRDSELNASWGTICTLTPLQASDGKKYRTTVASTEGILRIIQSIPSKKAEPFKLWLAQVGKERLDEIADPELSFERMVRTYREKGYTEEWIKQRLDSIDRRKRLTDEWFRAGVHDSKQYASLTNVLTQAWSGKTIKQYKQFKGLHKENLRDNMTDVELALNQLAEVSATVLSKAKNPNGYQESKTVAAEGGSIAGNARKELEQHLGESVISPLNASDPPLLFTQHKEKPKN